MTLKMEKSEFTRIRSYLLGLGLCDRCIGRQFRKVFIGFSNPEIGWAVRQSGNPDKIIDILKSKDAKPKLFPCPLCDSLFDRVKENANRVVEFISNYEFNTFQIGIRIPEKIEIVEKQVMEKTGEYAEPVRRELAREIGKIVEDKSKKEFSINPDILCILDFNTDPPKIDLQIKPLYIYGKYQKLKKDIPQTKWLCPRCRGKGCKYCNFTGKLYPTSVEEEIARPILEASGGSSEKFHGSGREDKDVLNIGWRPFIVEIQNPVVRSLNLNEMKNRINKSGVVKVNELRPTSKDEIKKIKSARFDKTYEAIIECDSDLGDLISIEEFFKYREIKQKTPTRVLHRRSDTTRVRKVKYVKCKPLDARRFKAIIRAESGTYIKELVSGDNGRTEPSFSSVLKSHCNVAELNVLEVHTDESS